MTQTTSGYFAHNIELLGYHDLGGRPAFKLTLQEAAGLRVYDIRDPRTPKEIAYFIPPDPKERIGTKPGRLVAQAEDVLVDRRGCIYISEKNHGIYILRLKEIWSYKPVEPSQVAASSKV